MSHTKGPWKFTEDHSFAHVTDRGGQGVAKVWLQGDDYSNADASLVAAAPELYEEVRELIFFLENFDPSNREYDVVRRVRLSHAKAAIAKARGEK